MVEKTVIKAMMKFGEDRQLDKLVEELSELMQAIMRMKHSEPWITDHEAPDNFIEECVDVQIMIEQFRQLYELSFHRVMTEKLERLKHLVGEE